MSKMFWNPLVDGKPFLIIYDDGKRSVHNMDELIQLGEKYAIAAHKAIETMKQVEIHEEKSHE